jgi:hypothetical protein
MPNGNTISTNCVNKGEVKFRNGDRVVFYNNNNGYSVGRNNPLVGTPDFCCGTVIAGNGSRVQWDNGSENAYDPTDLDFAATYGIKILNPNLIFKFQKRMNAR